MNSILLDCKISGVIVFCRVDEVKGGGEVLRWVRVGWIEEELVMIRIL